MSRCSKYSCRQNLCKWPISTRIIFESWGKTNFFISNLSKVNLVFLKTHKYTGFTHNWVQVTGLEQGWYIYVNSGLKAVASHEIKVALVKFWPVSTCTCSVHVCGLKLLLVLAFILLQGFFSDRFFGFPSSSKANTPNSTLTRTEHISLSWISCRFS